MTLKLLPEEVKIEHGVTIIMFTYETTKNGE